MGNLKPLTCTHWRGSCVGDTARGAAPVSFCRMDNVARQEQLLLLCKLKQPGLQAPVANFPRQVYDVTPPAYLCAASLVLVLACDVQSFGMRVAGPRTSSVE